MVALIVGILFVLFALYSGLPIEAPWALNWWSDVLAFLRGGIPIIALFVGLIAVFIGIADIKDRIEAKKEEQEEAKESQS
jgi:TRAP-type C4-dicarboxylate transport system permease small subunit